jgi:CDGSH-type Zn-finger protein
MPLVIKVRENGPFAIDVTSGEFTLVDHNGQPIEIPPLKPGKTNVTLCRCGLSSKTPFGDSTHSKVGWKGVTADLVVDAAPAPEPPKA